MARPDEDRGWAPGDGTESSDGGKSEKDRSDGFDRTRQTKETSAPKKPCAIGTLAALTYTVGPTLSWNILDFGRTLAQIRQSEAGTDEALARYEQTVLQALQDTETAVLRYGHPRASVARLARASASASRASTPTDQLNSASTISTIDALDVERQRPETSRASPRRRPSTPTTTSRSGRASPSLGSAGRACHDGTAVSRFEVPTFYRIARMLLHRAVRRPVRLSPISVEPAACHSRRSPSPTRLSW